MSVPVTVTDCPLGHTVPLTAVTLTTGLGLIVMMNGVEGPHVGEEGVKVRTSEAA